MKHLLRDRKKPRSGRGFTLIELIGVIVIVLVVMSLLMPAVSKVREGGNAALCTSNLRNIGSAFHLYAAENNGLFPAARFTPSRPEENRPFQNPTQRNWQEEVQPYFQEGKTFAESRDIKKNINRFIFCPTYFREYQKDTSLWNLQASGYGMNNSLGRVPLNGTMGGSWDYRFPKVRIEKPGATILAGDSDDYFLKVTTTLAPNPAKNNYFHGYSDRCGDPVRHRDRANYLFVDGHVASLDQEEAAKVFADQPVY